MTRGELVNTLAPDTITRTIKGINYLDYDIDEESIVAYIEIVDNVVVIYCIPNDLYK